ncbi:hypothetical protein Tco_0000944 [Tanacetum coccineum]
MRCGRLDAVLRIDQWVIECKPQLGTKISRSSNQYWMKEHVTESVTLVSMKMAETFPYVERIRQFLTPNIPDVIEDVIQPLIPTTLHTTPPNEDYVAPATKPILEKLLEDKILNVAMVDEEADPTRDLEEPERLLVKYPHFMEIHVHSVITKLEPFIHTQPLSPVYRIFESYKSSTKLYKVDREMKFPSRYGLKSSFPYPVANEHPNDVYCYFHPHLIPRTHFKSGLVGYHAKDDDGIFLIVDVARRSKLEAWLKACCLFIISSKIQGSFLL